MTARVAMTYQDYAALPDNGQRYEVHDGELRVTPAPTPLHQIVLFNLAKALDAHVAARGLGRVMVAPLDVILSDRPGETTILQPDVIFLARERLQAMSARAIEGPPTLAVEILSPSTSLVDRTVKRDLYAHYGVPYFWLVDLEARHLEARVLRGGRYGAAMLVSGTAPVDLPPFANLGLVPATLWV
jgi:Uma2 family endonuclease